MKGWRGDGEDGGDGVEREDDVRGFDGDEREEEHGHHAPGRVAGVDGFAGKEHVVTERDGVDAGDPASPGGGFGRGFGFFP